jgi:adenylate cyclase class 2
MIEIEVKFHLSELEPMRGRLLQAGATEQVPRSHELNWRYDRPDSSLRDQLQVLRLRQTSSAETAKTRLTFKDRGRLQDGVRARLERELSVSDFDIMDQILRDLGYEVVFVYEKYRTTFVFRNTEVVLDETPLGNFMEIEAAEPAAIVQAAADLALDWDLRSNASYVALFELARAQYHLPFRDMTFENLAGSALDLADIGLRPADLSHIV